MRGDRLQTVYVDLLFLINFSMDFLCFYISSKILSIKLSLPRAIVGAAIGGVYSVAALFVPTVYALSLLIDLGVCFIMCVTVYYKRDGSDILLMTLTYFAVSMALGGFMTAIFNMLNKLGFGELQGSEGDSISVWLFALLAIVSGLITLAGGRFFRKRSSQRRVALEISYAERSVRLDALVDSGNLLCDPMSGRPCVVADTSALGRFLPNEIISVATRGAAGLSELSQESAKNIRLVPTTSVGGDRILIALRVDRMTLDCGKGGYDVDALLALSVLDKESAALVPSALVK